MATTSATASFPISFFDKSTGKLFVIPVSALFYDGDSLQALPGTAPAGAQAWLDYLNAQGIVKPGSAPAPVPAMFLSAVQAGSAGNDIAIDVAYVTADKFDLTLTWNDVRAGLTPDGIEAALESRPGLVRYIAPASPPDPLPLPQAFGPVTLAGGDGSTAASKNVPAASGNAFSLEAPDKGDDGNDIEITIEAVDEDAGTFTLAAGWQKTVTGVTAANLESKLDELAFVLAAEAPPDGDFELPTAGSYRLAGGADVATARLTLGKKT